MKKIVFPFMGLCFLFLIFIFHVSCNKNNSTNNKPNVQNLKTGKLLKFDLTANKLAPTGMGELPGGGNCNCNSHGGSLGGSISWTLATCKTNCQKGIGFRCGRQGILRCQDGTVIICTWGSNCLDAGKGVNPERDMEATYELYENGTLKLIFSKPIPDIEKNSVTGHIFDVEQSDYVKFSSSVSVNGTDYNGFDILQGNYQINYTDGQFGSVVIGIQFKN